MFEASTVSSQLLLCLTVVTMSDMAMQVFLLENELLTLLVILGTLSIVTLLPVLIGALRSLGSSNRLKSKNLLMEQHKDPGFIISSIQALQLPTSKVSDEICFQKINIINKLAGKSKT